jgi:DNA helicase IV
VLFRSTKNKFIEKDIDTLKVYKSNLYSDLLLCLKYFKKPKTKDELLIIDEGQDLSFNEYRLLKDINGEDIIFNVYGDTNQLVSVGRGTQDWKDIERAFKANCFSINENYRNTKEITIYCNNAFYLNAYPIGTSGNPVRSINEKQMISELSNYDIKTERIAVITKATKITIDTICQAVNNIALNEIKRGYISVLDVEGAKGLEFDVVYVLPEDMNKNEKYIAFTRALSELIVVE